MTHDCPDKKEPRIVLVYSGLLIDDDSPLLEDKEWLAGVVGSRSEDDEDHGRALLHLAVYPYLIDQEAIDYIKAHRTLPSAIEAKQPGQHLSRDLSEALELVKRLASVISSIPAVTYAAWSSNPGALVRQAEAFLSKPRSVFAPSHETVAQEPAAYIEHHKGGDNLTWEPVDHPNAKATPLYRLPSHETVTQALPTPTKARIDEAHSYFPKTAAQEPWHEPHESFGFKHRPYMQGAEECYICALLRENASLRSAIAPTQEFIDLYEAALDVVMTVTEDFGGPEAERHAKALKVLREVVMATDGGKQT